MKDDEKVVKLFQGVTDVGDDLIEEAGTARKRKKITPWRGAAIAACLCLALAGTAFAASPALRDMLAEALGGFAPYAQRQEGETYVVDGMEFRVVSALADDFTVRAYIEARDLEGDRLSELELNTFGSAFGLVDIPRKDTGKGTGGFVMGGMCVGYEEETKTALLTVTSWGQVMADDLSGSVVRLFSLSGGPISGYQSLWENSEDVTFPVEVKPMPSLIADAGFASAIQAEEVRLSALGVSAIFKGDGAWHQYTGANISVKLKDGTLTEAFWEGGQGNFGTYGTESARKVLIWNFRQPVEPEQIEGVYMGEDYFPM